MIAFTAKGVAASDLDDLNSRVVVLAEDPDGDGGPRLEISRAITYTESDRQLGQDTYSLSTQSGATVYGGIQGYSLNGPILNMRVAPHVAQTLDVPEEFSIQLDATPEIIESVRRQLEKILSDNPYRVLLP
jgi:hypothetical protein